MTPQERIQQGVGVVGVRCAACGSTVLVVNAAEFARDLATFGAAYYVCKACEAHPGLEHALKADGDGTELLLTPDMRRVDLVSLIAQAEPQVWGSDERLILRQWLGRNTEPEQWVWVTV